MALFSGRERGTRGMIIILVLGLVYWRVDNESAIFPYINDMIAFH